MDYTVQGILPARTLKWVAAPFSRGSSQPSDRTTGLQHCRQILYKLSHKRSPRILEWVAHPFCSRSSGPRNQTGVFCIAGGFFSTWALGELLDSVLKSRDITTLTKVCLVKAMVFLVVRYRCKSWILKKAEHWRIDAFELWCWRRHLRVPWTARTSQSKRKSTLKDWCWSSNTLATWCEELTRWKKPWCRERLKARGEGDDREWDGWMASLTQWTWVWASSGRWWRAGKPGVLLSTESQRVRHDLATEQKQQLSHCMCVCVCVCVCVCAGSLSCVWLFVTPWTVAHQAPVHGIFQAKILAWVAVSSSKGSFRPRDWTRISYDSCIGKQIFIATEPSGKPSSDFRPDLTSAIS